ncbi:MAG: response regulator [Elusimicrobiota bacterium]
MAAKKKIMIVDDDTGVVEAIKGILEFEGYDVITAYTGGDALTGIEKEKPDLILLDWNLPGISGIKICEKIRKKENTDKISIIMLTARQDPEDEIVGLEAGADDYITKPYNPDILTARVKAGLRKKYKKDSAELKSGGISLNPEKHTVKAGGTPVSLWPKEFDLLYHLMKNEDYALSREDLLESVWGYNYLGTSRAIDATIKRLREKLGSYADRIKTVKGIGYKFSEQ